MPAEERPVISVWVARTGRRWFGIACHGERLVATAVGEDREAAAASLRRCLPRGREVEEVAEGSPYARSARSAQSAQGLLRLLSRLEEGEADCPEFTLCPDCVPEPLASVLRAAASIPRGYVATYGGLAAAAGTEARAVGRMMATNPLYPIVPCHRVVGADLSLVGYGGRQDPASLRAKLGRLRAEIQGYREERLLPAVGGLRIYPVEWAIARANRLDAGGQLSLW